MLKIQEYVDTKNYSTFKMGGQFRYFVTISAVPEILLFYTMVFNDRKYKDIPSFVLGGGSNIVFSSGVLNIFALKIEIKGFEIVSQTDKDVNIKVGAGEIWDEVVEKTVEMNLWGLESLSAIPGTVGATPVQNVGAYGSEVKDTIVEVEVFDTKYNKIKMILNKDCHFGYRDSVFKNEEKSRYIITAVVYRLIKIDRQDIVSKNHLSLLQRSVEECAHIYDFCKQYLADLLVMLQKKKWLAKNPSEKILGRRVRGSVPDHFYKDFSPALSYPGVKKYFIEKKIKNPTLLEIRQAIIEIRQGKLPDPKEIPNVGSFFKNSIVKKEIADRVSKDFPNVKFFSIDEEYTKIPAGWLMENSGLKGRSFGNISVYEKNALILVNNGNATKEDLMKAKNEIIKIVEDKFGITLEQEPEMV